MSLARRVRAGIALHAGVNVVFAAAAVLTAAGGTVAAEAHAEGNGDDPAALAAPASGLPVHAVPPAHPLGGDGNGVGAAAGSDAVTSDSTGAADPGEGDAGGAGADGDSSDEADADTSPPTTAEVRRASAPPTTAPAGNGGGATRRVESTGYCLRGITASGVEVGHGQAAMNGVPLGTEWLVHDGPQAGRTFEVTDRIGHSTEFDIWFATCDDAIIYGRRTITVEQIG